jgi:hypothetical protein
MLSLDVIPGATVTFFKSEEDFFFRQNSIGSGVTNASGGFEFINPTKEVIFVFVEKDTLNNLRGSLVPEYISAWGGGNYTSPVGTYVAFDTYLSTSPARLQLTIVDNTLSPIAGAIIQLYLSADDHIASITPDQRKESLKAVYGNNISNDESFKRTSEIDGTALFDNLEPRKYWFKVNAPNGKTNSSGIISTPGKLNSNYDITTSLTVIIN